MSPWKDFPLKQKHQPSKPVQRNRLVKSSSSVHQAQRTIASLSYESIYRYPPPPTPSRDSIRTTSPITRADFQDCSPHQQDDDHLERLEVSTPEELEDNTTSMTTKTPTDIDRCPKASEATLDKLSKLLGDTSLSDFTIKCNDREWKVHRFVLTLHSTVLQAACTHGFKEEKERMLDLSEEDVGSVGAFVYYLYHHNYDAAVFREDGDYLSLHVQMCVLGDKYDMRPLQDLAMAKFQKQTTDSPPSKIDLANAAVPAYDAIGATTEIRKIIVKLAIDQKLIPTEISAEPVDEFERALQACPGLCLDIVKMQQSMITPVPRTFFCPSCGNTSRHEITMQTITGSFTCSYCRRAYVGWQWAQRGSAAY